MCLTAPEAGKNDPEEKKKAQLFEESCARYEE
jgi:hypothetical protein